ncbi:helix-turn-helix domain-containing protein [Paenibacillus barcinonensis]|uniref:Helix-turn-helix domain-containing protein n=1 Tax=Paenibacillus barcinonensis TaxID=198119 RepID=A0A2V4W9X9_PAEBA|nr:helix-turn-helix domain-containing protein [Paenibacillus barcinonensis]PYE47985.1 response regulator receiver domain-containing protein [Paenibacillus barcinonensis]QKS55107.1 helix-turn-helix domain-containing protein [Paenibacillus barcinonensis]
MHILLVDYSHHLARILGPLLEESKAPFTIKHHVSNSSEALAALSEQEFNVVVVHTEQYDAAGLWLCHHIRQISDIPIVLLGGRDQFRLVRKALTYQVNDYLPAPFKPAALLHSLHRLQSRLGPAPAKKRPALKPPIQLNGKAMDSTHVIRVVKAYVREHLHEELTLKRIADMLHFNCAYLGQKFKTEEKISFNDYMLHERMKKAKHLLLSTNLRIYEIALEVGYRDIDWFYKKFKVYAGSSPNAYRRQKANTA